MATTSLDRPPVSDHRRLKHSTAALEHRPLRPLRLARTSARQWSIWGASSDESVVGVGLVFPRLGGKPL